MGGSSKQGQTRADERPILNTPNIMKSFTLVVILVALVALMGKPQPLVDEEPITHLPQVTQKAEALAPAKTEPVAPTIVEQPKIPTTPEEIMASAGIPESDWGYAKFIIQHESGWCHLKWETQYGACPTENGQLFAEDNAGRGYGLCQSTPANKMASAGEDWRTNAVTQMKWCNLHAQSHHGGWANAYAHWVAKRWW